MFVALLVLQSLFLGIVPPNVSGQAKPLVRKAPESTRPAAVTQTDEKSPFEIAAKGVAPLPAIGGKRDNKLFESDAGLRREWFRFQRSYPFPDIPAKARENAFAQAESLSIAPMVETWQPIGPRPTTSLYDSSVGIVSGRINAIAASPADSQLILVGSSTGGIWRSTDGGTNWSPVSDDQVAVGVGSINFAPSNPNVVYAGMGGGSSNGDYLGSGVLKSTDAGATWTPVTSAGLPLQGITSNITVDPANENKVYLSLKQSRAANQPQSISGGLYIFDGMSWTGALATGADATDFAIHPTNSQTLYSAFRDGLYLSTDGGMSWSATPIVPISNATSVKVAVTPASPNNVYLYFGNNNGSVLMTSPDSGVTWSNLGQPRINASTPVDTGQFSNNCYLKVALNNANAIYIGNRDLFRSTDGGANWSNMTNIWFWDTTQSPDAWNYSPTTAKTHSDQQTLTFAPGDNNVAYIGHDGGITKVSNLAATPIFESLNENLGLTQFIGYTIHPTDAVRSYGGSQDNGTQRRLSGSQAWKEFDGGDGGMPVLNPTDPSQVFANYPLGSIGLYTGNGTSSETIVNPVWGDRVAFYAPLVTNGVDDTLYFGTTRVRATNINTSPIQWFALGGNVDLTLGGTDVLTAIGVQRSGYSTSQSIYTGSALGRLMVSQDGGQNWTDRTAGLPTRFVKSITVKPGDANTAYVTFSGFSAGDGTGHVYRTTDAGANWTDISGTPGTGGLPEIPVNSLLIDPNDLNKIYVGTDIGVYRTTVGGTTWEAFTNGIPPAIVNAIVSTSNGATIQAATYGRGAYQLNNGDLFQVTYPNTDSVSWAEGSAQTVTWHIGGNAAATVNILLSADGGQTFPFVLASGIENDGTQQVFVPDVGPSGSTLARVKVETVDNTSSDVSDLNFTIIDVPVFDISGRITKELGDPLSDATVTVTDSAGYVRSVTTDANGDYVVGSVPAGSDYTIRPSKGNSFARYLFAPESHTTGILSESVVRNFISRYSRQIVWTQLSQVIAIQEGNPQNIQRNNNWNNAYNWSCYPCVPNEYDRIIVNDAQRTYQPPGGIPLITYTPQAPTLNGLERTVNRITLDGSSVTGGILNLGNEVGGESVLKRGLIDVVLNVAAGSSFDWQGGTFNSAAVVAPNAYFMISGDGEHLVSRGGVSIDNAGEMRWYDNGTVKILQPCFSCGNYLFAINNAGTFRAEGDGTFLTEAYTEIRVNNTGTFVKTSTSPTGATKFLGNYSHMYNSGTFNVQSGIAEFGVGGQLTVRNGSTLTGGGLALINGGTWMSAFDETTVSDLNGNLEFRSGRADGRGTYNGTGIFNWTGGTFGITQGGGYPTDAEATFGPNVTTNISGSANKHLGAFSTTCNPCYQQSGRLTFNGTTNWSGTGDIYSDFSGGSSITNNGTFNIRNDEPLRGDYYPLSFTNNGTVKKLEATGTTTFGPSLNFTNAGIVDNQTGTIDFTGSLTLNTGSRLKGAGTIKTKATARINANVQIGDAGAAGNFELVSGTFEGGMNGPTPLGTITSGNPASRFIWSGGEIVSVVNLDASLTTTVTGPANKDLGRFNYHNGSPQGFLNNAGTINIDTGSNIRFGYHYSTLTNSGTINAAGDVNFIGNYYTPLFTNTGTINKTAPLGAAIFDGSVNVVNSGTLNASVGLIEFNRELYLDTGTIIKGDGVVRAKGTTRPRGTTVIGDAAGGGKFELAAGTLEGQFIADVPNSFINSGNAASEFRWTGGQIFYSLSLGTGLTTNITGAGFRDLGSWNWYNGAPWGALINAGTINWQPGSDIRFAYHSASITNSGTFNLHGNGTIQGNYYGGSVTNTGTIEKINTDGATTIASNLGFNSSGTIKVSLDAATNTNRLNVGGATLGGTLSVKFTGGYDPSSATFLQIIGYGSRSGTFNTVTTENLNDGRSLQTRYNANNLSIRPFLAVSPVPNTPSPENWFKADALAGVSNSPIPTWLDSSGKINEATQTNAARQPKLITNAVNGKPAVRFDGVNDQLQFDRTVDSDFTITAVFQSKRGGGSSPNWWDGSGLIDMEVGGYFQGDFGMALNADGRVLAGTGSGYPDTSILSSPIYNDGKPHVATFTRKKSTGERKLYVDGVLAASDVAATNVLNSSGRITIGSIQTDVGYLNGDIPEVLVYNSVLSDTDRGSIYAYLTNKYAPTGPQTVWDAAADFLPNRNPAFGWTYGYSQGGVFSPFTDRAANEANAGIDRWNNASLGTDPSIRGNLTGTLVDYYGTARQTADELSLHPNHAGAYSVLRWTAPEAGSYLVQGRFDGNDYSRGTTSDVKLNHNANTLLASPLNGFGTTIPFNRIVTAAQGDTLDFAVGKGTNNADYDITGLAATITKSTMSISGNVTKTVGGGPLAGITVHLKQNNLVVASTTTDAGGSYAFASSLTAGANYVVEPLVEDYSFAPATTAINALSGNQAADFAATQIAFFAEQDFSITNNPSGAWRYGWTGSRGSAFNQFTTTTNNGVHEIWYNPAIEAVSVAHRVSNPAGMLQLHPGIGGQYPVLRWIAPASGTFRVFGSFVGNDCNGPQTSTDVAVLQNSQTLTSGNVIGCGNTVPYDFNVTVNSGDTIDFTLGFGVNGWYGYDSTSLSATIRPVTATATANAISGTATGNDGVTPIPNAVISLYKDGRLSASALTNAAGQYSFPNLVTNGDYVVSAAKTGSTFSPASRSFLRISGAKTADFTTGTPTPITSQCTVPSANLVSWYRGEDNPNDHTGGNNGTLESGVSYVDGKVGRAFDFTANGGVALGDPANLKITNQITLSAWVKPRPMGDNQFGAIIGKWNNVVAGDSFVMFLYKRPGGGIELADGIGRPQDGDPGWYANVLSPAATILPDTWTHVTIVYDAANGVNVGYVNGIEVGRRTRTGGITNSTTPIYIGRRNAGGSTIPFNGAIDEPSIFNRVLTAGEIRSVMDADASGQCSSNFANTPQGANVGSGTMFGSVTFPNVSTAGTTTFTVIDPTQGQPAPPSGYSFNPSFPAYDISSTAVYSGSLIQCLTVPGVSDPFAFVRLRILHIENGIWVDRTYSRDFATRTICSQTTSLSPFAVADNIGPTASNVTVAGRVLLSTGRAIQGAIVRITDSSGVVRQTRTSATGDYSFNNVAAGGTYVISVVSKQFRFAAPSRVVLAADDVADVDFTSIE